MRSLLTNDDGVNARGLRVLEVDVSHRPRLHGRSHYGTLDRAFRGLLDTLGMVWLIRRRLPAASTAVEVRAAPASERQRTRTSSP